MELFTTLSAGHWLALGLVLLIAEALGAAGFLIGAAVAAFAMAAATWFAPDLSLAFQLGLFSVAALLSSWVYLQMFRGMAEEDHAADGLHQRALKVVGTTLTLVEPVAADEETRVQIGDTFWRVWAEEPLAAGVRVRVVGTDPTDVMRLRLEPVDTAIAPEAAPTPDRA